MFRKSLFVALAVIMAFGLGASIYAATNGVHDDIPPYKYPNVGGIVFHFDDDGDPLTEEVNMAWCGGILIAPRVFLTAGHCVWMLEEFLGMQSANQLWITFEPNYIEAMLNDWPAKFVQVESYVTQFDPGDANSWGEFINADSRDLAALILVEPVQGLTPASLPSEGLLSQLAAHGGLNKKQITQVGYGWEWINRPVGDNPEHYLWTQDGYRTISAARFLRLNTFRILTEAQSAVSDGGAPGGLDSGSPRFLPESMTEYQGMVIGITEGGKYPHSTAIRLDTPWAQDFLSLVLAAYGE